MNSTIYKIQLF